MPYAVEMWLDAKAEKQLRTLREALEGAGVIETPSVRPFQPPVSLSICENVDEAAFAPQFKAFAERMWFPELLVSHVGMLHPSEGFVIHAGVTTTERLLDVHKAFNDLYADYADSVWEYYRPSEWVPHATLAERLRADQVPGAMAALTGAKLPFLAQVQALALVEVPSGRVIQHVPQ